jgi:hypothetical protein
MELMLERIEQRTGRRRTCTRSTWCSCPTRAPCCRARQAARWPRDGGRRRRHWPIGARSQRRDGRPAVHQLHVDAVADDIASPLRLRKEGDVDARVLELAK